MGLVNGQLVQHAFSGGLDDKTDERHVDQTKFLSVTNGRLSKAGRLSKRPGIEALATTTDGAAHADTYGVLANAGSELVYLNGSTIASYSPARSTFVARGNVPSVGVTQTPVFGTADTRSPLAPINGTFDGAYGVDVAESSTLRCFVWNTKQSILTGKIACMIVDKVTGTVVLNELVETTENYYYPRVCCVGSDFFVFYVETATLLIQARKITVSATITIGAAVVLATAVNVNIEVVGLSDRIIVVAGNTVGPPYVLAKYLDTSLATIASASVGPENLGGAWGFSVDGSTADNSAYISWCVLDGANYRIRYCVVNATTLATTLAATTVHTWTDGIPFQTSIARSTASLYYIGHCGQDYAATARHTTRLSSVTNAGVVLAANTRRTHWTHLASDVFVRNGRVYSWLVAGGAVLDAAGVWGAQLIPTAFYSHLLVDWRMDESTFIARTPRIVGAAHPRIARKSTYGGSPTIREQPSSVVGTYSAALIGKVGAGESYTVNMVTADFTAASRYQSARFGDVTYFSGGAPFAYDGIQTYECGFNYDVQGPCATPVSAITGGLLNPAEVYFYSFCYAWVDATGQVVRGAPSAGIQVTVAGADDSIVLEIPTLSLTQLQRPTNVWIEIYRTSNGGSTLFLLDTVKNNELAPTVTYTDTYASAAVDGRPQLYTNGGAVPNVSPPALTSLVAHKGRLFGIGPDAKTVWFSSQYITGQFPAFHDEFTLPFDFGSDLTALGSLDAALVMFTNDRIWYLPGDGPLNTLARNDYGLPTPIASDVGCINQRSIVQTPLGLFFQSRVGIYLLTRGLEVQYVGAPVETSLGTATIVSATVHPTDHCVYFETTTGRLVFDYRVGEWLKDTHVTHATPLHGVAWGSAYHFTTGAGVYRETKATYLSVGSFVPQSFRLGWTKAAGPQGHERVEKSLLLIAPRTKAGVTISTYEDYETATPSQTQTWGSVQVTAAKGTNVKQLEISHKNQQVTSKTIEVTEVTPDAGDPLGTGQGLEFIALAYELAQNSSATRLPSANKR